jgi:hypothetical protein
MPPRIDDAFKPNLNPAILDVTQDSIVSGVADDANADKIGVYGYSRNKVGVWAHGDKTGLVAQGLELAAEMFGDVRVRGHVTCDQDLTCRNLTAADVFLTNADVAEDFDIADGANAEPGTVMVLVDAGALRPSDAAYDRRVAGVISGAGSYKPGVVLDRQPQASGRMPVALFGKVYCKADADDQPIEVGDLLTTSATVGHAMKATDPARTVGAIIGKALGGLRSGRGLVPVLVALQ